MAKVEQCFPYLRVRSGFGYTWYLCIFAFSCCVLQSQLGNDTTGARWVSSFHFRSLTADETSYESSPEETSDEMVQKVIYGHGHNQKQKRKTSIWQMWSVSQLYSSSIFLLFSDWLETSPPIISNHVGQCGFSYRAVKFVGGSRIPLELLKCETSRNDSWLEQHVFISWSRLHRLNWF